MPVDMQEWAARANRTIAQCEKIEGKSLTEEAKTWIGFETLKIMKAEARNEEEPKA